MKRVEQAEINALVDEIEATQPEELLRQIERSEPGFREGRSISWEDVQRRANLPASSGLPLPQPEDATY